MTGATKPLSAPATSSPSSTARFTSSDDLRALVDAFESRALTRADWTHAAHVSVAVWYVMWCGKDEATARRRAGLQRLNAALGVRTTPTGGYHETITRF